MQGTTVVYKEQKQVILFSFTYKTILIMRNFNYCTLLCSMICIMSSHFLVAQASTYEEQIPTLAKELLSKLSTIENVNMGIINFVDKKGQSNALGEFLAEEFTSALTEEPSANLKIIGKDRVHFFLKKEHIQVQDLANPTAANRLSKKADIAYLIKGKTMVLSTSVRLSIKVMNLKNGQIVATTKGTILRSPIINELLNESITTPVAKVATPQKEILTMRGVKMVDEFKVKEPEPVEYFEQKLSLPFKKEINRLEFQLEKVKRSGTTVTCFFTIINKAGDVKIKVDKYTRIYNSEGRFFASNAYQFDDDQRGGYLAKILTTGVPVKAQFIFRDVPPTLTKITKLEVPYYAGRKEQFDLFNIVIE